MWKDHGRGHEQGQEEKERGNLDMYLDRDMTAHDSTKDNRTDKCAISERAVKGKFTVAHQCRNDPQSPR